MLVRHPSVAGLRASRVWLLTVGPAGLLVVLLLLAAVLVVRGSAGPGPGTALPSTPPATPEDLRTPVAPVALDALAGAVAKVAGAGLGDPVADLDPPLSLAPGVRTGGCRAVGRGDGDVLGWVVADRVVSVALLRRGPDGVPLPLAVWVPDPLAGLLQAAESSTAAAEVVQPVARADLPVLVRVVRVPLPDGELVLSDLGRAGGARWAEVRTPTGAGCALVPGSGRRVGGEGPDVGPGGSPDLLLGTSADALRARRLVAAAVPDPGQGGTGTAGTGCTVVSPGAAAGPGVSSLVVRDGALAGVGLRAGSFRLEESTPAVAVGDPAARVAAAFPGQVGAGGLRALVDNSGLVVRVPGARVVVQVARPAAVVPDVDVQVAGELLVTSLQVTRGC